MMRKFKEKKLRTRIAQLDVENHLLRKEVDIAYSHIAQIRDAFDREGVTLPKTFRDIPLSAMEAQQVTILMALRNATKLFNGIKHAVTDAAGEISSLTGENVNSVTERLLKTTELEWDVIIKSLRACADILDS